MNEVFDEEFASFVRASDEGARGDVEEAEGFADALKFGELIGMDVFLQEDVL